MPHIVTKDRKRRGFILLTHALMVFFTIAMIGLAVDAGTMYVIKGRLSSAVDAAALAAGRSVNLANTVPAASAAATATATQFFNANFPNGYLGTGTMNLTTPTFTQETDGNGNPNGILDISVNASVPAPTYFMQIFGIKTVNVSGTGTATRRGTVMILVLDTSVSMNTPGNPTACQEMVAAAQQFITNFSPYDTIGAVQFGYTASVLYAPSTSFGNGSLNTALGSILTQPGQCGDNTNTTSGLWLAYEQIKSVGLPLAYNSIVLFTDGSPNGVSANFPIRTQSDVRYGKDYTQYTGAPGATCTSYGNTCTMPVICTAAGTVTGTLAQGAGQTDTGATNGLFRPVNTDAWASYPATCNATAVGYLPSSSNNGGAHADIARQILAYIPDFDIYGNSTHGVPTTSTPPTCPGSTCTVATVTLGSTGASYTYDTRDFWRFQCNNVCTGATGSAAAACSTDSTPGQQYEGGVWTSFPADLNSNFFTAGPYKGFMRPDQPTTIVAATMNTAMAEAYWIRGDASGCGGAGGNGTACATKFHPVINTIYLLGNAGDAADHEFLPIMSNTQTIPALPYDSSWTPYTNPAFLTDQEQGLYQVTADKTQLTALFQKLASEVLRLSH
ncbi:MAG TPA: vWA domain-containing protein [Bryobacteraceae bacterium]|jgi:Flp pilus assembly protein TadG|nr:vWA domain-containing protein [Bryobacteraceae bacterium]